MPSDPTLWLYTSLTAGSSHIITGTSRIETILKANKIPFKAVDCATDDKARMIWQRRSKGKKLPGLVKFNDVIADLEQIEEWNEHGELEDEIESVIDIFGDVPVSGTVAEAQAAAAAIKAGQPVQGGSAQARTASETRHISISEPSNDRKKSEGSSTMAMAMRQAGAEAAAKAGQKKAAADPAMAPPPVTRVQDAAAEVKSTKPASAVAELPESQEPSAATDAKTPSVLASEGAAKTSVDKINAPVETGEESSSKSTLEQTIDQRRKSSVPNTPSSLAKSTSVSEAHTVSSSTAPKVEEEEEEEDDDSDEDSEEEESEEDGEETTAAGGSAKKVVSATDKEEAKVTGRAEKTQKQGAKDGDKAGVSVGD